MITIYTNNQVAIDGAQTGLSVVQERAGTRVYHYYNGQSVIMPLSRYTLSSAAGRDLFESHLNQFVITN